MKPTHSRAAATASAIVLATLAISSCTSSSTSNHISGNQASPGVTDTSVTVGIHLPLTGPAAAGYAQISAGMKTYFDYLNAHGGVQGRAVHLLARDDAYNPATTQQVVRQLVLQDKVFAIIGGVGTPTHAGVLDFLNQNKVPDLFVNSAASIFNQPQKYPYTYAYPPSYIVEGKILASYVKQSDPGKKICDFAQNDDFGNDHLTGVHQILGANGLAATERYNPAVTDIGPQIGALKAAGCQVVLEAALPAFAARALTEADRQGLHANWVASGAVGTYPVIAGPLGTQATLADGMVTDFFLPSPDDTANPWSALLRKIYAQYGNGTPYNLFALVGMSEAYDFTQLLQRSGRTLTRGSIIDAINRGGLTGPGGTYSYSPTDHAGISGFRLVRFPATTYFSPTYVTDDGSGPVTVAATTVPTPPAIGIPSP